MSNLFYRGGGGVVRAGSNLSILKEAKKNYMGQFIFSRGVGVYLLIPFFFFFVAFPWVVTSTGPGGFMMCVYYMTGAPEGSPKVVL